MRKKYLFSVVLLVVLICGITTAIAASKLWNKPLGPSLGLPTSASELLENSSKTTSEQSDTAAEVESPSANPSLLSQLLGLFKKSSRNQETQCGGPSSMTILLIGSDEGSNDYLYGLADSIRLVRVDFTTATVMLLDIPRDLWVEIPGISDHYGITHGKLNQAYFFGNPGMGYYDGPGEGPGLLARTLDLNFGVRVDHYLAVDTTTFINFIDQIGGIDIYLDQGLNLNLDPATADPKLIFSAGKHHFDGETTLLFASSRNPTIFQRARYQNMVLSALQDKLLSPSIIPEIPGLISQFSGSVQTDLSPSDINHLICIGKSLSKDNTEIVAFPEEMFTGQHTYDPYRKVTTYTMAADFNKMHLYFVDFMNGTWP